MRLFTFIVGVALAFVLAYGVLILLVRPSNDREWQRDQEVLATAEIDGPLVTIRNIRDFRYESVNAYEPSWYDKTFDLGKLERAWFVVEPFGSFGGAAHTFMTFGFGEGDFVAISVEIRKERDESFSAIRGLFREYELMYVVGDERDLIDLRANHRLDDVYLYPVRATPEQLQAMFLEMIHRANELAEDPEFYNTITNTCTTNLVRHVNTIAPGRIPMNPAVLMPGYSDNLAWSLGLIDTDLAFEQIREQSRINEAAAMFADDPDFSLRIRQSLVVGR